MDKKITAFSNRGTWELVTRPAGATVVTCRWIYTVKYEADSTDVDIKADWLLRISLRLIKLTT